MIEHRKIFENKDGTKVEIKMETDCHTKEEMCKAVSFMAQSSHEFYLEMAEIINSKL